MLCDENQRSNYTSNRSDSNQIPTIIQFFVTSLSLGMGRHAFPEGMAGVNPLTNPLFCLDQNSEGLKEEFS